MRGFSQAIALLSSAVASAFVVPEPVSIGAGIEASEPVVDYHASRAILSFHHDDFRPLNTPDTNITIEIGEAEPTDQPCDQNNVRFLGSRFLAPARLSSHGELRFTKYPSISAKWQIHCLLGGGEVDIKNSDGEVATKVLSVDIQQRDKDLHVGFTVSYTQLGQPSILRFQPRAVEWTAVEEDREYWRTSSPFIQPSEIHESEGSYIEPSEHERKTFKSNFRSFSQHVLNAYTSVKHTATKLAQACRHHVQAFKAKVHKAMGKLCSNQHEQYRLSTLSTESPSSTDKPIEASPDRPIPVPSPAQTRSIHPNPATEYRVDAFDTLPTPTNLSTPPTPQLPAENSSPASPVHFLKLLFIALTLFSLLTWLIIRIRDPRRRADRAARREEWKNKNLYRHAAWVHWWSTRICVFRHRHCPCSRGTGTSDTWDEKRGLVLQQEAVLEAVCQDDIGRLRASTRPRRTGAGSIAAAEEGRNVFVYDSDGEASSTRRHRSVSGRSMTTLPGYESEATQPPGYATEDITPDSSIVSTSPRISRDGGLGSEDGLWAKEIEPLDLVQKLPRDHAWRTREGGFESVDYDGISQQQPAIRNPHPFAPYPGQASLTKCLENDPRTSIR